ncbi:hypothetical protein KIN20_029400 [Parelaphostrongylus tenuis]|uniref:Uncharacterized protein n=1 Tax=Parelaphostrongylus tenuis TaxID=148309 RepID=A0AAD5R2C3_PARTN|nr:hypothetical protein KIN20_029400 [Parelaphostrongylus tenuis]
MAKDKKHESRVMSASAPWRSRGTLRPTPRDVKNLLSCCSGGNASREKGDESRERTDSR